MDNEFKLDSFLKENYYLFAVMGIFGAISIYLNTIHNSPENTSKDILPFGIIASLFLFIVTSLVILRKLLKNNGSESLPISLFKFNVGNVVRIFFAIPFSILTITIYVYMITNLLEPFKAILSTVSYALGILVLFGIVGFIPLRLRRKGYVLTSVCFIIMIVSTIAFYYIENNLKDHYYLLTFFSSLVAGSLMFLVIIPISYLYDKLRKFITRTSSEQS